MTTIANASSTIKGHVRISEKSNTNDFLLFQISAVAGQDTNAWYILTVANEASSATSPFANTDDIVVSFQVTGDKGDPGAQGAQGADGADNSTQGAQGTQGLTGPDNSTQGAQGTTGPDNSTQGAQGTTGPDNSTQGAQGTTGPDNSTQGAQGADGADNSTQGAQGIQGLTGPDNSTQGAQGTTGPDNSTQGAQGTTGPDNSTQGAQGTQGLTGPDNSTQGAQGATGPDNSTQGATGTKGAPGNNAGLNYDYETSTDMAGAAGAIRFDNTTIGSATQISLALEDADGVNHNNLWSKQSQLIITGESSGDIITVADYSINTINATRALLDVSAADVQAAGTFVNGESVRIQFTNNGAKGQKGATGVANLSGDVSDRLVTADGSGGLVGEPNFTFDGSTSYLNGKLTIDQQALLTTGTVAFNPKDGSNATVAALTGNLTITLDRANHWEAGDTGVVRIKQSGTTARTVTFTPSAGSNVYLNGSAFTMPTTLSSQVVIGIYCDGTDFFYTVGSTASLGTKGAPGGTGPQGASGTQGPGGAQGTNGTQGATGAGPQGPIGPSVQGATGTATQGADGPQGPTGADNSTQGATGGKGEPGADNSTQGADGPQGPTGADNSTQGADGPQGPGGADNSTQGAQGVQGTEGPDNSTQGATGADSTVAGPQGPDGGDGPQGADGPAGAVTGFTNGANDRVLTATGTTGINAEANLVFNGDHLTISAGGLHVGSAVTPATVGKITATNDVVAFASSDKRFKDNIIPISNALEKIKQVSGVEFDWRPLTEEQKIWIHSNEGHDIGVIAQEIEEILPEIVTTRENGYKAVRYEKIVALLIEAIKEQQIQIDQLKNG